MDVGVDCGDVGLSDVWRAGGAGGGATADAQDGGAVAPEAVQPAELVDLGGLARREVV